MWWPRAEPVTAHMLFLLGFLCLTCSAQIQKPEYDETPEPEFLNPDWMSLIPDERSLSQVTLPGTHNSMALYGGVLAQCQSWSLALQLQAGVRFLDVRVRHIRGNLTVHHGVVYQRAHLGDVLEGVANFLQRYPSETVLMRLREEYSETGNIYSAVVRYVHQYAHWDLLWHSRRVPTMGQARGKIIILQDFAGPDLGMRYNSVHISDHWRVPTLLHIPEKWQSVKTHLEAAETGSKDLLYLTYISGAGLFAFPNLVALRMNALLYEYLTAQSRKQRRYGIQAMDFPGACLLQTIIHFNFGADEVQPCPSHLQLPVNTHQPQLHATQTLPTTPTVNVTDVQ